MEQGNKICAAEKVPAAVEVVSLEEKYNDYERTPVPEKARKTWFEQGMVWLGEGFGLSGLAVGGVLAQGLSFWNMVFVAVVGSLIVFLMASVSAMVSTHTHMSSSFSCRRAFGLKGAKIIGFIFCFSNFGWYAFQADLFGNTISTIVQQLSGHIVPAVIFTVIGGLAMSMTAVFGIKAIKALSEFGLPLLFILCFIAVWKTGSLVPFTQIVSSQAMGTPMSISAGIAIVVGSFAGGIAVMGDFSRFSKSKKDCVIGVSLGYFWGYIPVMIIGAIFAYAFGNWNIVEVMIATLGLGIFGVIVLVIGQWTTNDNNLYGSALGLMNTLDGISKIPRMRLTFIIGAISTAIAVMGLYKYFVDFLSLLGVFITPITGIVIADFYVSNRSSYDEDWSTVYNGIKWDALLAWMTASFVGLTMTNRPIGFGWFVEAGNIIPVPIVCIIVSASFYMVSQKLKKRAEQKQGI